MEIIAFTKVKLPYGWLGNMAAYPIEYEGKEYRTTEALFQALRFVDYPDVQEKIREEKSPMSAKMVAKAHLHLLENSAFQPRSSQDIANMDFCLREKLRQHPQLVPMLLETGDRPIVEDCTSRPNESGLFWGAQYKDEQWSGSNILGKLWMRLRKELILQASQEQERHPKP